jgi:hypothetical protein
VPFHNEEAPLPIHGIKCLLQVDEDPIKEGLFDVGKLLSQLCLYHCSVCSSPVPAALQAVVQGNHLKPMIHHPFNDFPYRLKVADAAIIPTAFGDEESDNPPKLDGYLAFIPDGLDKLG